MDIKLLGQMDNSDIRHVGCPGGQDKMFTSRKSNGNRWNTPQTRRKSILNSNLNFRLFNDEF